VFGVSYLATHKLYTVPLSSIDCSASFEGYPSKGTVRALPLLRK